MSSAVSFILSVFRNLNFQFNVGTDTNQFFVSLLELGASRFSHRNEKYQRILTGLDFATRRIIPIYRQYFGQVQVISAIFGVIFKHYFTILGSRGTISAVEII